MVAGSHGHAGARRPRPDRLGIEHLEPVLANQAHEDPRVEHMPGTPADPDSLIVVPLVARGIVKGTLTIYRLGEEARFDETEFELARRFADAAALAMDNAQIRARLEHQAQTDSLTGLYNHRHFHERLKGELARAGRTADSVALVMIDFDDFKRVNDIHGHAAGDGVLVDFAELLRLSVRQANVICRVGGEEFGVIMPSSTEHDAVALAGRIRSALAKSELSPDGPLRVSIGIAEGPKHALNARELAAFAEAAMMTAKAAGGDTVEIFTRGRRAAARRACRGPRRPLDRAPEDAPEPSGKLNRLNDVRAIGAAIVTELRSLVDYNNCRVLVVDGDELQPIAFRGDVGTRTPAPRRSARASARASAAAPPRQASRSSSRTCSQCDFAVPVPDTPQVEETVAAVPLRYGPRVIGVIVLSKLGADQLDGDDVRLLEVLAGHASVALENARLYEEQRRAAELAAESAEVVRGAPRIQQQARNDRRHGALGACAAGRCARAPGCTPRKLLAAGQRDLTPAHRRGRRDAAAGSRALHVGRGSRLHGLPPGAGARTSSSGRTWTSSASSRPPGRATSSRPVVVEQRRGVLALAIEAGTRNETRMLRLLTGVADQAALAMTRACAWEALESMFVSTVDVLANALEATDQSRSTHARLDQGRRPGARRSARYRGRRRAPARVRRALPRHRQDRRAPRRAAQARPADLRGALCGRAAPGDR